MLSGSNQTLCSPISGKEWKVVAVAGMNGFKTSVFASSVDDNEKLSMSFILILSSDP